MRVGKRTVRSIVVSAAIFAVFAVAGQAIAVPSVQADFGTHVAECAHTHGFDGQHNPGMHEGRSGWPGTTC